MTDMTDEQIAKERAAVEAMRNARANMDAALRRIHSLEGKLHEARRSIDYFKSFVPAAAYNYDGKRKLHDIMDDCMAEITKILGSPV